MSHLHLRRSWLPLPMRTGYLIAALSLASLGLVGCDVSPVKEAPAHATPAGSSRPTIASEDKDGPPDAWEIPSNILNIPDAVPRDEPFSVTGNPDSYVALGQRYYVLRDPKGFHETGMASWYGKKFHGKPTSSGEAYDMFKMTAAHRTLPIPCYARVTNTKTHESVIVRINDRGPFHSDRIIDVSYTAAAKLGMLSSGEIPVDLEVVEADKSPKPPLRAPQPNDPAANTPQQTPMPRTAGTDAVATTSKSLPGAATPPDNRITAACPTDVPKVRYLQTGVFKEATNAHTMRDQLIGLGFSPVQLRSAIRDGKEVYRVVLGPLDDSINVEFLRKRLSDYQLNGVPLAN